MFARNLLVSPLSFVLKRSQHGFSTSRSLFKDSVITKSVREILELDLARSNEIELNKTPIRVVGWVKSFRDQKQIKFLHLNDGQDIRNLQVVYSSNNHQNMDDVFNKVNFNAAVEVVGVIVKSPHAKQNYELQLTDLKVITECNPDKYPFKSKAKYKLDQIRPYAHLRTHNQQFANIMQFRSHLTFSLHEFFARNRFVQVHTPIITSNNCEGGCETFQIKTNDQDDGLIKNLSDLKKQWLESMPKEELSSGLEDQEKFKHHFFHRPAYLTASAQLHLEAMTTTLGNVYTISPTFRAEKSLTRHHLAEFYMLEAELVDMNNLDQLLDFAEIFIKQTATETYKKLEKNQLGIITSSPDHADSILKTLDQKFHRITYTETVELLNKLIKQKKYSKVLKKSIEHGEDLNKEQEKLLTEYFQGPVFVTKYPKAIKPFYMRESESSPELVDNFDLLVPGVGEIIGGSLRENRVDLLERRIRQCHLDLRLFDMYLETKKYGAMRMGGFGLGLERLVQYLANIENIRDTCAFPRHLYSCKM